MTVVEPEGFDDSGRSFDAYAQEIRQHLNLIDIMTIALATYLCEGSTIIQEISEYEYGEQLVHRQPQLD